MAKSDLATCFEHTRLPHGDDGKQVRGVVTRCGKCGAAGSLPVNTMGNTGGNDDEVEWRFIARKMEHKGWQIGRRRQDHRCPRCVNVAKLVADGQRPTKEQSKSYEFRSSSGKPVAGNMALVKEALMNSSKVTNINAPARTEATAPEPKRHMTREDRRVIFAKLEEVYVSEKVGYGDGWSDEKVATDLGVPRAWVSTIRDENFGEEITSEHTRKMIAEAKELMITISRYRAVIENSTKALIPLFERADKIEKTLAEIAKVTR